MVQHLLAVGFCLAGVVVVVACSLLALRMRRPLDRLHLLAPMTTVGAPLVTIGLAVNEGWTLPGAQIVVTGLLVSLTGPAMASATGRVIAMQEGTVPRETPE